MNARTCQPEPDAARSAKQHPAQLCGELIAQRLREIKADILAEARREGRAVEQMLQLALNEAAALAEQTRFPHLLFPTLALERVRAVTEWRQRQAALQRGPRV